MPHSKCPLCVLEKRTRWYFENTLWAILDCETCKRPMVVVKKHLQPAADEAELAEFLEIQALKLAKSVFMDLGKVVEGLGNRQRVIKDHWHRHIFFKEP